MQKAGLMLIELAFAREVKDRRKVIIIVSCSCNLLSVKLLVDSLRVRFSKTTIQLQFSSYMCICHNNAILCSLDICFGCLLCACSMESRNVLPEVQFCTVLSDSQHIL